GTMDDLESLLIVFAGLLVVNAFLAVVLWYRHRTPLYRAQVAVWLFGIASLVVQGLVRSERWIPVAFALISIPMSLALAELVGGVLGLERRWRLYLGVAAVGLAIGLALTWMGAPFWARSLPMVVGAGGPLLDVAIRGTLLPRGRVSATGWAVLVGTGLFGVHQLD